MTNARRSRNKNVATAPAQESENPAPQELGGEATITPSTPPAPILPSLTATLAAVEAEGKAAEEAGKADPLAALLDTAAAEAAKVMPSQGRTFRLHERVMQAHIEVSTWTGEKSNSEVADEVAVEKNASADAGRYIMRIVDKVWLDSIKQIAGKARLDHYSMTFPGMASRGPRLLAVDGWQHHVDRMNEHRAEFFNRVETLIEKLPEVKETSRKSLGDMWEEDMFPSAEAVRKLFKFNIRYYQLPEASSWVMDMADENLNALRKDMAEQMTNIFTNAVRSTYDRVFRAVSEASEKLREYTPRMGKGKGFRDSMFDNLRELADTLPRLNFTQDERIAEIAKDLHDTFDMVDGRTARESDKTRDRLAAEADKIAAKVAAWMA